jgi:serine/threonine protein phosphatase PrpC
MNSYKSFSTTVIGISHTKHGKECQDFSYHYPNAKCNNDTVADKVSIAVVTDGHGSDDCFRSAKGAIFAAECAVNGIRNFVNIRNQPDVIETKVGPFIKKVKQPKPIPTSTEGANLLRTLIKHIVAEWHGKVKNDYTTTPFTEKELVDVADKYKKRYEAGEGLYHAYGTTLIAVAVTADYWFGFHLGDGRFTALYKDGSYDQPVPWDERCYLNVTTSICDDDATETARFYFCPKTEKDLPLAVYLCSDGVDDNYPVDDNDKHLFKLYRTITETFAEDGFDSTCTQIKELANSFATKGKGDDTSIAGVINMEVLEETGKIYKEQMKMENTENSTEKDNITDEMADQAKARFIRGELYENQGRKDEANSDFELAVIKDPRSDEYRKAYERTQKE